MNLHSYSLNKISIFDPNEIFKKHTYIFLANMVLCSHIICYYYSVSFVQYCYFKGRLVSVFL